MTFTTDSQLLATPTRVLGTGRCAKCIRPLADMNLRIQHGAMSDTAIDGATYINLRSYKRDGNPVDTPVWQAPLDGKLMVFTDGTSFKVKRIGRNPRVQVARCDVRGKLLGPWLDGTCKMIDPNSELEKSAYRVLNGKYGLLMRLGTVFSTLAGRVKRRRVLCIALDGAGG